MGFWIFDAEIDLVLHINVIIICLFIVCQQHGSGDQWKLKSNVFQDNHLISAHDIYLYQYVI